MAGILGLNGLYGILFYLFVSIVIGSLMMMLTFPTKFSTKQIFHNWSNVLLGGLAPSFLTFILMWTIAYDCVYIFF
jgi:hypothetical protein